MNSFRLGRRSIKASLPASSGRLRDDNPIGRWKLLHDAEEYKAGACFNGYNLRETASMGFIPEGAKFSNGRIIIICHGKHFYTSTGESADPCYSEQ